MKAEEQAVPVPNSETEPLRVAKILHISDLHFGWSFDDGKWDEMQHLAAQIRPDLILVTGDLVESPWRWRLATAKESLLKFREALRTITGKQDLEVLCVPGNHDTRIQGVFPVRWLMPLVLACSLALFVAERWLFDGHASSWLADHASQTPSSEFLWASDTVAAILMLLIATGLVSRGCLTTKFIGSATGMTVDRPIVFKKLGIGIAPFDSATHDVSWARGRVRMRDMYGCEKAMGAALKASGADRAPFWIAVVHHHPLPLPYDDDFERMMVMDNAGAFLSELGHRGIRLVLHGHKHHQHFARIAVQAASKPRLEVAVLSAGTPTRGRTALVRRHGFNTIEVTSDQHVTIRMHESDGGTFSKKAEFDLIPHEEQARWQYEQNKLKGPLVGRRMVCEVEVNGFGDARFGREFWGIQTTHKDVKTIPNIFTAHAPSGFVEGYRAQSLSLRGPGVMVRAKRIALNEVHATIEFKYSGLQPEHEPIDFLTEFQSNNAFALNRWQFRQMYPERHDFSEDVQFMTPAGVALEEMVVHVRFASEAQLPKRIDLRWKDQHEGEDGWKTLPAPMILRIQRQSVIQVQISFPKPNAIYQVIWDLEEGARGPSDETDIARCIALRTSLARLSTGGISTKLRDAVKIAEVGFRDEWRLEEGARLHAALYYYDSCEAKLKCLFADYPEGDPRHTSFFKFGLGIAGRAFKASTAVTFVKPHDDTRSQTTGYVKGDGSCAAVPSEIPEEMIVAFALAPPGAPDWPYAVLQLSSDLPSPRLTAAARRQDQTLAAYGFALNSILSEELELILRLETNLEARDAS